MDNQSQFPRADYQNAAIGYNKLVDSPRSYTGDFNFGESTDRRFAYSRQASFRQNAVIDSQTPRPVLVRNVSSIDIPPESYVPDSRLPYSKENDDKFSAFSFVSLVLGGFRSGNKQMRRLFLLISLNVAYSSAELFIGLFSGSIGLVSDAFHLTFGCSLLSFSLFAMAASRQKPDHAYTYGYKRLEVLSAFTNALFLLFMSFSLAVEALHAFIQDESEHNAGLILASWLLSLGVDNAEVLCLALVSVSVFMLVMPLFKTTGGVLLQMAPPSIPSSALSKCWRQVSSREDIVEVTQARFWELVPGHVVGSISIQVKEGIDDRPILQYVHALYHDIGVQDLTLQTECA